MVDGGHAHRERVAQAHQIRNVAGERQLEAVGGGRDGVEDLHAQPFVHLEMVDSGGVRLAHQRASGLGIGDAVRSHPDHRRCRHPEARPEDLTRLDRLAERHVLRPALHAAHDRHAVGHVQEQHVLGELRTRLRIVAVHLGDARHQEASRPFDHAGPVGHVDGGALPYREDAPVAHQHGLVLEHARPIHGQDVHAHDRDGLGLDGGVGQDGDGRRQAGDERDERRNEATHGEAPDGEGTGASRNDTRRSSVGHTDRDEKRRPVKGAVSRRAEAAGRVGTHAERVRRSSPPTGAAWRSREPACGSRGSLP